MINSYITSTYLLHLSVGVYYIFNNNNNKIKLLYSQGTLKFMEELYKEYGPVSV